MRVRRLVLHPKRCYSAAACGPHRPLLAAQAALTAVHSSIRVTRTESRDQYAPARRSEAVPAQAGLPARQPFPETPILDRKDGVKIQEGTTGFRKGELHPGGTGTAVRGQGAALMDRSRPGQACERAADRSSPRRVQKNPVGSCPNDL